MPKISPIKGHNDSSFQGQSISQRNIPKFKDQPADPIIRVKNTSFYDAVVPIYEVSYDPEFSKSPLASVQMFRKAKPTTYEPILDVQSQERSHVVRSSNYYEGEEEQCNWKKILCWIGVILGILAFIVGLYFLVDFILGKNTSNDKNETNYQGEQYTAGITPIYVNPIPYVSITPTSSISSTPIDHTSQPSYETTTYPSILPNSYSPQIATVNSAKQPPNTKPVSMAATPVTTVSSAFQTRPDWGIDPEENSIEPLNAYENVLK